MSEPLPQFVARRRAAWEQLETLLGKLEGSGLRLGELEEVDRLYRRIAADLAHAQSFYPATDALRFLNALSARAYGIIYQAPRDRTSQVRAFFQRGFPQVTRANAAYVWASLGLLVLGAVIGAVVVWLEPNGAKVLVPDGVREAVAHHEMWTDGMLSLAPPSVHASAIATNNLTVTLIAFASGILLGVGTLFVMINNGVLIGAVVAHCVRAGMGFRVFSFMGAHGPVELTCIVLSGAAGLMVGHALLEPGEVPRSEALRRRGVQAVQLVVGCAPFLGLIGIVEGFVSPGDLFPGAAKIALGLALGTGFWTYLLRAGRDGTETTAAARSARRAAR